MNQLLTKYQQIIDQLPSAAKSIILAAIVGLTFILWYYIFWQDLQSSITTTSDKIITLKLSIPILEGQLKTIENDIKNKKIPGYGTEKDKEKNLVPSGLLSPHQTTKVLHDLLTTSNNLVLLQLTNTPPKAVMLPQINLKAFEHEIIIKFLGDYFSTLNYLQSIENLKWKIFWDSIEYKVVAYPNAEITLHIHTTSTSEDWIYV